MEEIKVTVANFRDQGWGGCLAELWIYLHDPTDADTEVAKMKLFGPLRTDAYDERKHGRSPSCTIGEENPVVALAKPGMVYKLRYKLGGGGGYEISVKDWRCKILPKGRSKDDVSISVNSTVKLDRADWYRGPDRVTGKYELEEPPYPVEATVPRSDIVSLTVTA